MAAVLKKTMQRQAQQHHNHHDDYKGQKEQKHIFPKRNVENKDRDSEHFKIAKNGYKQSAEGIGQNQIKQADRRKQYPLENSALLIRNILSPDIKKDRKKAYQNHVHRDVLRKAG